MSFKIDGDADVDEAGRRGDAVLADNMDASAGWSPTPVVRSQSKGRAAGAGAGRGKGTGKVNTLRPERDDDDLSSGHHSSSSQPDTTTAPSTRGRRIERGQTPGPGPHTSLSPPAVLAGMEKTANDSSHLRHRNKRSVASDTNTKVKAKTAGSRRG